MAMQVASLFGVLTLDDSQFRRGLQESRSGLDTLGGRMQAVGGRMQSIGTRMAIATAPVAGLGTMAIHSSNQFNRAFTNVLSITGQTGDEAEVLRRQLIDIGSSNIFGAQATTEAFYGIVSGVQDASTHMAILDASVRTAEAGQADLAATTSAMISAMNAYGLQASDASWVSDVFSRTVGMGVLSMDEMANVFPQVAGLAAQFGEEADDVGGSLAYLTTQGIDASQAGTYMRGMITTLLNPTADLAEVINALGYESGLAMLESEGLVGAYRILANQGGGLAGLITNQEALTGSLLLTKDTAADFISQYLGGIAGATEAQGAIQDQSESWLLLNSRLQGLAITAGDQLTPLLIDLIDNGINPAITSFMEWSKANPETFKTLMMVMGGVVILGPAVAILGTAITGMGTVVGLANVALGGMPAKLLAIVGPIGLVAAAVAGVVIQLQNFDQQLNDAAAKAHSDMRAGIEAGLISRADIEQAAWNRSVEEFGDLGARLIWGSGVANMQGRVDQMYYGQMATAGGTAGRIAQNPAAGVQGGLILDPGAWGGFAAGGYTGDGPSGSVAGMVHAREYVVPEGGALVMRGNDDEPRIGPIYIQANDAAGGRAAADAFSNRLQELIRARGLF